MNVDKRWLSKPRSSSPMVGPQSTTHVGQDVRDLTNIISLTRQPEVVVEDEINRQKKALKVQSFAAIILALIELQALSISPSNGTRLTLATNSLFSAGVLLDVIGAFYAWTSAYNLDSNLSNVKSFLRSLDDKELGEITHLPLSQFAKTLARQNSMHPLEKSMTEEDGGISGDKLFRKTSLERYSRSIQMNKTAGQLASGTIALGFVTFPAGFLCQLQDTQPLAVRITAYTVVGMLVFIRFLLIPLQDRIEGLIGRRLISMLS